MLTGNALLTCNYWTDQAIERESAHVPIFRRTAGFLKPTVGFSRQDASVHLA
jgi:hypothetical protein